MSTNLLSNFPGATPYLSDYQSASQQYGIPVSVLVAQGNAESGFNPNAVSPTGAQGISQFEPATAAQFGINPLNPAQSISAQAEYMSQLTKQFGSLNAGLQAYNEGPAAFAQNGGTNQTEQYATGILNNALKVSSNPIVAQQAGIANAPQILGGTAAGTKPATVAGCTPFDVVCYLKKIVKYVLGFQGDMVFFTVGFVIVLLTVATLIFNSDAVKTSVSTATKLAKLAK